LKAFVAMLQCMTASGNRAKKPFAGQEPQLDILLSVFDPFLPRVLTLGS
jgi:hypothetical protein